MPVDGHEFGSAAATERLLVTREDLERDAREIRERGYALSWEDVTAHACALGVPVYDEGGAVVGALSLSGIVQHFSPEELPGMVRKVVDGVDELAQRLCNASWGHE